ncbi:MAG TPA: hypothetical protein VG735_13200 [Caulobacterales bacterium]|nr:hypothetical protein [Caulobacterales bacterium]
MQKVLGSIGLSVLAATLMCGAIAFAQAPAAGLRGLWVGYYAYSDGRPDRVQFQLKASRAGAAFTATTIEPNTFGSKDALFLTADVAGTVSADGGVRFTKTYDGTGGQTHSVEYSGMFDASKRCISGNWRINAATGPFRLCIDASLVS